MRDAVVALILVIGILKALRSPWIGILLWTWISIMNPHRETWHLSTLPVAAMAGGATLIGMFISRDKRLLFLTPPSAIFLMFTLWMCITYPFSFYPDNSLVMLTRVLKINFMIFVLMMLLYTRKHIIALVWVLVGSLAYYGVKGGAFTIMTGGNSRVWGPTDSFIGGNNEIALALIMSIPLMYFLRSLYIQRWVKHAFIVAMVLTSAAIVGSQSRGALLGIAAMAVVFWMKLDSAKNNQSQKTLFGVLILAISLAMVAFMPQSWTNRMHTIGGYQQDASAEGRINAWHMAWNLASNNFFGGGFEMYYKATFMAYAPNPYDVHAAHSIYFQVLGEHGFVGLFLFLLVWFVTWRWAGWLRRNAKNNPDTEWAAVLGSMVQASLAGYLVAGAFLSLAYFDLPYNLMALVVLSRRWVEHYQKGESFEVLDVKSTGVNNSV
jgi:probable O-glycosylation ligase (exosortase A-associated)